jgi:hypothetical protein
VFAKAADELGDVVMAGLDRALAAGGHKSRVLARSRSLPRLQKNEPLQERVRLRLWNAWLGGSFEMDWFLIAILIAAVGAHLIVAGFGR